MSCLNRGDTGRFRGFLLGVLGVACLALAAVPDRASANESASQFIGRLGGDAMEALAPDSITERQRESLFRELLRRNFDTARIARFVLGRYARRVTGEEMKEFAALYEDRLVFTYARLFTSLAGYDFAVKHETGDSAGPYNLVITELARPGGGQPVRLDWQVRFDGEGYTVFDIKVDGVSMALAHRDEYAALFGKHKGDVSAALQEIRVRVANNTKAR